MPKIKLKTDKVSVVYGKVGKKAIEGRLLQRVILKESLETLPSELKKEVLAKYGSRLVEDSCSLGVAIKLGRKRRSLSRRDVLNVINTQKYIGCYDGGPKYPKRRRKAKYLKKGKKGYDEGPEIAI